MSARGPLPRASREPRFVSMAEGMAEFMQRLAAHMERCAANPPRVQPDCESPIEERLVTLFEHATPFDAPTLERQVVAPTSWGTFRFDFMFVAEGRRIVVECDGKAFHDPERDVWRDAVTLGCGAAEEVWRFPGAALHATPRAVTYLLAQAFPAVFSAQYLAHHEYVATLDGDAVQRCAGGYLIVTAGGRRIPVARRTRTECYRGTARWSKCWTLAKAAGSMPLDDLLARHRHDVHAPEWIGSPEETIAAPQRDTDLSDEERDDDY